ncbi:MAG TPA: hypothetical protein VNZ52_11825 [Candidatus Thermoplasmatota archaeon]|nr:hypothetical protein [Candidatus Thermoplasmatota archaeon]
MSSVRAFELYLTAEDILDVEVRLEGGAVMEFVVNYRERIGGTWREVVRYDTCHGYLHRHRFWLEGPPAVQPMENPARPAGDYGERLTRALGELRRNWRDYRSRMELK